MDDSGELRLAPRHVAELSDFFAAHDRWLFGHACVRTRGDREGTVHAHLHAARGKLVTGLAPYYPFGQDHQHGAAS
jgi:hypothetical protein